MRSFHLTAASIAVGALALAGCSGSVSVGSKTIAQGELETQVSAELANVVGSVPESVSCPDELAVEAGSTVRCSLVDNGATYGVTVTSTGEGDNGKAGFTVLVDSVPQS